MTRRKISLVALLGALALLLNSFAPAFLSTPQDVEASSHREAPLTSQDPSIDSTDLYAFVSPDKPDSVTFIANYIPYEGPAGGPNFYRFGDDVAYEIHVNNKGDAQDNVSFLFTFKTVIVNPNTFLHNTGVVGQSDDIQYNLRQYGTVTRLDAPADGSCKDQQLINCATAKRTVLGTDVQVAPANVGPASFPLYPATAASMVYSNQAGYKVFLGPRADPFFIDLGPTFDLLQLRGKAAAQNSLAGFNVHTIALQVPIKELTVDGSAPSDPNAAAAVIGTWTTASRRATKVYKDGGFDTSGSWVQVSRLGMPLVNEVVVPLGLKDAFSSLKPWQDGGVPAALATDPELGRLLTALFGLKVPPAGRLDLVTVFFLGVKGLNQPANPTPSEMLRLNVAIPPSAKPSTLGVLGGDLAGFPNGRRLTDDVVDIELRVVAGVLVDGFNVAPNNALTDNVDAPSRAPLAVFPYAALPYNYQEVNYGGYYSSK